MRPNRRFSPRVDSLPGRLAPTIFTPPALPPLAPPPIPEPEPTSVFWDGLEAVRVAIKNSTPLGIVYDYFYSEPK